jgi:hypothetical protein
LIGFSGRERQFQSWRYFFRWLLANICGLVRANPERVFMSGNAHRKIIKEIGGFLRGIEY